MTHLGLRVGLPDGWHVIVTPADRSDDGLIDLDLDRGAEIVRYVSAPAAANSIISPYGILAVSSKRDAFVVVKAQSARTADLTGSSTNTPAGSATRQDDGIDSATALVRIQPDWSLWLSVDTRATAPTHAADHMSALLGSLAPIGPPATTAKPVAADGTDMVPDALLAGWLPTTAGDRALRLQSVGGRWFLVQPTAMTSQVLGVGNVFDLCVSMASTVDEIAVVTGGLATEPGKSGGVILGCRADGATNERWVDAVARLIPHGPVRAPGDRPIWHATSAKGDQTIGLLAAGRVAIEVISADPTIVDAAIAAMPPDL